jgi:pimeloyl-ACP methyl ester carboxylesterase
MAEPKFQRVETNGIALRVAEMGSGPLVLFCHGWPESWYSWRHQLKAVADAGFRAVAPDMRGYGASEAPSPIESYTQLHLVGDMVGLVTALGESQAVVVGHDWGAPVAWNSALLRPDMFRAVVGMSVPWTPPSYVDVLSSLEKLGIKTFYMQYFQRPGVAEAEFERDIANTLRRVYFSGSGDAPERSTFGVLDEGGGFLDKTVNPEKLPAWLSQADLDYFAGEFKRAGFRGGLNWYRNLRRNWELFAPWRGQPIKQPSLFIAGSRDGVLKFPASMKQIEAFPKTLPGIRGSVIVEGAGHWIQQERPAEVNQALVGFLKGL